MQALVLAMALTHAGRVRVRVRVRLRVRRLFAVVESREPPCTIRANTQAQAVEAACERLRIEGPGVPSIGGAKGAYFCLGEARIGCGMIGGTPKRPQQQPTVVKSTSHDTGRIQMLRLCTGGIASDQTTASTSGRCMENQERVRPSQGRPLGSRRCGRVRWMPGWLRSRARVYGGGVPLDFTVSHVVATFALEHSKAGWTSP